MILTKIDKKEKGYGVSYYNLERQVAYTLKEEGEGVTEVSIPFRHEPVEDLLGEYLWALHTDIDRLEAKPSLSDAEKVDLLRYKNNLYYLVNYDYEHTTIKD